MAWRHSGLPMLCGHIGQSMGGSGLILFDQKKITTSSGDHDTALTTHLTFMIILEQLASSFVCCDNPLAKYDGILQSEPLTSSPFITSLNSLFKSSHHLLTSIQLYVLQLSGSDSVAIAPVPIFKFPRTHATWLFPAVCLRPSISGLVDMCCGLPDTESKAFLFQFVWSCQCSPSLKEVLKCQEHIHLVKQLT